jgi:hypothetical protein
VTGYPDTHTPDDDMDFDLVAHTHLFAVPKSPDRNAIDRLCVDLVNTALRGAA